MLEIAICDDEKQLRTCLGKILEQELDLNGYDHRITEYASGEELIRSLPVRQHDIYFLDIEMAELDGVATAKEIRRKDTLSEIIFVTSYPDFVFQGYEVQALNYILKPYKKEKILEVLHTALTRMGKLKEDVFMLEQRGSSCRIVLDKVLYFFSERHCVTVVTTDETRSFPGKLTEVEEGLPEYFIRIHNRYLVNLKHVEAVSGSAVILSDQNQLPVSRSCKQELAIAFARRMLG
ncbi:MAG: LytTR family DNA-binding domain-containing protein [Eubacteriales bacterium]|nr:LytTR family DNA-binding domain-containing protein [Eubacteriales bacterium]